MSSLLIPVTDDTVETFTNRFSALFSVDVTAKMDSEQPLFSASVQSGSGTICFIDLISDIFDAAR